MRRAIEKAVAVLAAAGALAALSGCSEFERLDFVSDTSPPVDVLLTYEQIRIPEGVAVTTTAYPTANDGVMSRDTRIELKSANPGVLGVALALPQEFDENRGDAQWSFVLFGVEVGATTITVRIDEEMKAEIPAFVDAQ